MKARPAQRSGGLRGLVASATVAVLAACTNAPPAPDWQADAKGALDRAVAAYLKGDTKVAEQDFERARQQIARTGRLDLMARAELMRCAAQVASLLFEPCTAFERLRADAHPGERAYADHLLARALASAQIGLLPAAQQAAATGLARADAGTVETLDSADPQSRLIATALLFKAGKASPALIEAAVVTASSQGWSRPLLAWLEVLALRADGLGQAETAQQLRRRRDLVHGAK